MSSAKKKASAGKAMNCPLSLSEDSTSIVISKKNKSSAMASNIAKVSPDKVAKSKAPFRYRWQKNGHFDYQDDLIAAKDADSAEEKNTAAHAKKSESVVDVTSDNENAIHSSAVGMANTSPAPDADGSDMEFQEGDGSDDDYDGATSTKQPMSGRTNHNYTQKKGLKPNPNGRVIGRKLVMWHRPRMVEKLMLHLQYECHRSGLKLPWDKAVERLSTGSSGSSALQHLNKLRDILITEGHLVPPLLGKYSVPQDPNIRGYVRNEESEKPTDTKVVLWGEPVEDRKENLAVEGVIRGSGNYRRGLVKALEKAQKASGERRNRLPIELRDKPGSSTVSNFPAGTKKVVIRKRRASDVSSREESLDPAEMASEEEYDPSAAKKKGKYGLRKVAKPMGKYNVEDSDDEMKEDVDDETPEDQDISHVIEAAMITPQTKRVKASDAGHGLITPPSNQPVVLHLQPELLKKFPPGPGLKNEVSRKDGASDVQQYEDMDQDDVDDGSDFGVTKYESTNEKDTVAQYSQTALDQQIALHSGYQGVGIHGLKADYDNAILNGLDPEANGFNLKKTHPSHAQEFAGGESRVSSAYKYSAPPPYSQYPHTVPRQSSSHIPFTGTSAGAFPAFHGNARNRMSFDQYMASGFDVQNSSAPQYDMMDDPFYMGDERYTSGTDIFQRGTTSFSHHGLPTMHNYDGSNDGQTLFANFGGQNVSRAVASAPAAPATGFQVAADNTAQVARSNYQDPGDHVSEAHSSPAHYIDYMPQAVDDNKENSEYYGGDHRY